MVGRATRLAPFLTGARQDLSRHGSHRLHLAQRRHRGADRAVRRAGHRRGRGRGAARTSSAPCASGCRRCRRSRSAASASTARPAVARRLSSCPSARSRSTPCAWWTTSATASSALEVHCGSGTYVRRPRQRHRRGARHGRLLLGAAPHGGGSAVGGGRGRARRGLARRRHRARSWGSPICPGTTSAPPRPRPSCTAAPAGRADEGRHGGAGRRRAAGGGGGGRRGRRAPRRS